MCTCATAVWRRNGEWGNEGTQLHFGLHSQDYIIWRLWQRVKLSLYEDLPREYNSKNARNRFEIRNGWYSSSCVYYVRIIRFRQDAFRVWWTMASKWTHSQTFQGPSERICRFLPKHRETARLANTHADYDALALLLRAERFVSRYHGQIQAD